MITDVALTEIAKAIGNESYVMPAFLVFGSTAITETASHTSLSGEAYARDALSESRSVATVSWIGTKLGTLASSSGDLVYAAALNSGSTGGSHLAEKLFSSFLNTTDFDVEVTWNWTVTRG